MQEGTIDFGATALTPSAPAREQVSEKIKNAKQSVSNWLDSDNDFYSRIADFKVNNRTVVKVNIVTVLFIVGALAIAVAPLASVVSIAASAWLTYQYNHTNKKGARNGR